MKLQIIKLDGDIFVLNLQMNSQTGKGDKYIIPNNLGGGISLFRRSYTQMH